MVDIKLKMSRHNNAVKKKKEKRGEVPSGCTCTKDPCPLDNKRQVDKVMHKNTQLFLRPKVQTALHNFDLDFQSFVFDKGHLGKNAFFN